MQLRFLIQAMPIVKKCAVLLIAVLIAGIHPLAATVRTVTNLNDSGAGSLRDQIAAAANGDTINFSVQGTIGLQNYLTITKSLTIGGPASRSVYIDTGINGSFAIDTVGSFTISNLQFTGGRRGVEIRAGNVTFTNCVISGNDYVGLRNDGTTDLFHCTIAGNQVTNSYDCQPLPGAGINNTGTLTLYACSIYSNTARHTLICSPEAPVGDGLQNSGTATLTNCTFTDNLRNESGALTLKSCTIVNSGISNGDGGVYLQNTLLDRSPLQVTGTGSILSQGYNLSTSNGEGFLTNARDQLNADPKLDQFGLNGGATSCYLPGRGSAAIDRGFRNGVALDQRGQGRPIDFAQYPNAVGSDGSDIGAVEATEFATTTVNVAADTDDGFCGYYDCSLREAVAAANANADQSYISFEPTITGTIFLSAARGPLTISSPLEIRGPGARTLTVSGSASMRVFNITSGPATILDLTMRDGITYSTQFSAAAGGAVLNSATATFRDCAFVFNLAFGQDGGSGGALGGFAQGGAIFNNSGANLTVERCTFQGNGVDGGLGGPNTGSGNGGNGGLAQGGAIFNDTSAALTLNNCTFANNSASGGAGGANPSAHGGSGGTAKGAGIFNRGTATLTSCTLRANNGIGGAGGQGSSPANNGAPGTGAGGIRSEAGSSSTLRSSLIAENTGNGGADANGAFTSQGYNLIRIGDFGSGFNGPGDQVGTAAAPLNPRLGPLQNNGGDTDTIDLLPGSPAIDQGNRFGLTSDQRGLPRPLDSSFISNANGGDGSDIGAFEVADNIVRFTAISRLPSGYVHLEGIGLPNRQHSIQFSQSLAPNSFQTTTQIFANSAGVFQCDLNVSSNTTRLFFRATFP